MGLAWLTALLLARTITPILISPSFDTASSFPPPAPPRTSAHAFLARATAASPRLRLLHLFDAGAWWDRGAVDGGVADLLRAFAWWGVEDGGGGGGGDGGGGGSDSALVVGGAGGAGVRALLDAAESADADRSPGGAAAVLPLGFFLLRGAGVGVVVALRARLLRAGYACVGDVEGAALACLRAGAPAPPPPPSFPGASEAAAQRSPFLCEPGSRAFFSAAAAAAAAAAGSVFPQGFWGALLLDLTVLDGEGGGGAAAHCVDGAGVADMLRALRASCAAAPPPSEAVAAGLAARAGTLLLAEFAAGAGGGGGATAHCAAALLRGMGARAFFGGGRHLFLCAPAGGGDAQPPACDSSQLWALSPPAPLAAFYDSLAALSQCVFMQDASLHSFMRRLLRAGLDGAGAGAGAFHPVGLPAWGPRYVAHFSAAYWAPEEALEGRLKGALHARLPAHLASLPPPGAGAPPPLRPFPACGAPGAAGPRVLVIDAHWHRGMTPHRCTAPLARSIAAAAPCTHLLYAYHQGLDGDEDTHAGAPAPFASAVGAPAGAPPAWRAAAAAAIAASNFSLVWLASAGMTDWDVDLISHGAALAPAVAVSLGHPSPPRARGVQLVVSGLEGEVLGPLSAPVGDVWGAARGGACATPRALLLRSLLRAVGARARCGASALRAAPPTEPWVALCGEQLETALAHAAARGGDGNATAPSAAGGRCELCAVAPPSAEEAAAEAAAAAERGGGGEAAWAGWDGGEGWAPGAGGCRSTLPVPPRASAPGEAALRSIWGARLAAAAARAGGARLLLVPGVGYGFTSAVRRSEGARGGGALPTERLRELSTLAGELHAAAAARAAGGAWAAPAAPAPAEPPTRIPPPTPEELAALPPPGASPLAPLRIALPWSNPKWNPGHVSRLRGALLAAGAARAAAARVCSEAAAASAAAAPPPPPRWAPLCAALAPHATLHLEVVQFTPVGGAPLRAAAARALLARALPPHVALNATFATASLSDYLGRLSHAHLALDAQPFSAGVTAQDADAAGGLPLLTAWAAARERGGGVTWRGALGALIHTRAGRAGLVAGGGDGAWEEKLAVLAQDPWLLEAWRRAGARVRDALRSEGEEEAYGRALLLAAEAAAG
jgi:hypothetical protein